MFAAVAVPTIDSGNVFCTRRTTDVVGVRATDRAPSYHRSVTRVLLAEDDLGISEPLSRVLRRHGYDVDVAGSGPDALERAPSSDLVVLEPVTPVGARFNPS